MRLLEAVNYPIFDPVNTVLPTLGVTVSTATAFRILGDFGTLIFDSAIGQRSITPALINFPVPRLGRVWEVDRFSFSAVQAVNVSNTTGGDKGIILQSRISLNGVFVSDEVSSSITSPSGAGQDITTSIIPVTILPFNPLEVRSGDQLALSCYPLISPLPTVPVTAIGINLFTRVTVVGENNSA